MEKVKELRERLEKKLEELEKVEGADRSERAIEETKALLALSDEELINKIEENYKEKQDSNKEISEEELDNVAGGRCSSETWECPECGRIICWSRSFPIVIEDHLREHKALRELYGDAYDRIFHPNK